MEVAASRWRWSTRSFCSDKSRRYVTNRSDKLQIAVGLAFCWKLEMLGSKGDEHRLLHVRYK
jgi:hypothetical protein